MVRATPSAQKHALRAGVMADDKALTTAPVSVLVVQEVNELRSRLPLPEGAILSPTGLKLPDDTDFATWVLVLRILQTEMFRTVVKAELCSFALGDALNFGERFGEQKYTQAVIDTGLSAGRLANIASTCSRVPESRRQQDLLFAHHEVVAALPPQEQESYLKVARNEELSSRQLGQRIKSDRIRKRGGDPALEEAIRELELAAVKAVNALPESRWATALYLGAIKTFAHAAGKNGAVSFLRSVQRKCALAATIVSKGKSDE